MQRVASLPLALQGKTVTIAGRLATLTRSHAIELIASHGGMFASKLSRSTAVLIVGLNGWPMLSDGRVSGKLRQAQRLRQSGAEIEIVREDEFLQRLGLGHMGEAICRRYLFDQVASVAGVPRERLRGWLKSGVLQPIETVHGVPWFDFRQISAVKRLQELTQAGVTPQRLRQSLKQLETWLPDAREWVGQLELFGQGRRLVARAADGMLIEPDGQKLFDFGEPVTQPALRFVAAEDSADDQFRAALELEERADYAAAAAAYREWLITFGPDAQVCFNLANTLLQLGRHDAAAERYRQAIEIDPDYVEAWSNLGCALAEQQETHVAIEALERAIELAPSYADARYNLADILDRGGFFHEARRHWQAYLQFDHASPWADYAREKLAERRSPEQV